MTKSESYHEERFEDIQGYDIRIESSLDKLKDHEKNMHDGVIKNYCSEVYDTERVDIKNLVLNSVTENKPKPRIKPKLRVVVVMALVFH